AGSMSAGPISSSASEEMINSLISCSSACTGMFSRKMFRKPVGQPPCRDRFAPRSGIHAIQESGDGQVLLHIDHVMEPARGYKIPFLALSKRHRRAFQAHRRDVQAASDRDV